MKKIGRKKKKALYKRLRQLEQQYEEIMEKSSTMEDALEDYYMYGHWSPLCGIYMKLRYFLVLKWAEENHVNSITFQEFPCLAENDEFGRAEDIRYWGERLQFHLMEDEYDCCISHLIWDLKVFGWEIDALDYDEIRLTDSLEELLEFLTPEMREVLLEILTTECGDDDEINFIFLKNRNLGKYYQYVNKKPNKRRIDTRIQLKVDVLVEHISVLLHHYIFGLCSSLSKNGEFCAVCGYGSFVSCGEYLGLYEFDPVNIIRAWYLEQYLKIAQRLYGY